MNLGRRTVLVTGATHGIGRAVALELAAAGAAVAIHGRSAAAAADLAAELTQMDRYAGRFLCDLGDHEALLRLVDDVSTGLPDLDTLVLVAGADVLTGAAAAWGFERKLEELLRVDVTSTMILTRAFGRQMKQRWSDEQAATGMARGNIVTTGWDQAESGMEGDSGELFAASKGAVMAFTRSVARSLSPQVRVNCVAPGWIRTKWGEGASEVWQKRAVRESMLGRWGEPADIAAAVRWLVSSDAAFVTGQVLPVNGGFRRA
ncbi:MAG: SDR family oxidoreductase [Planctomycetota bacterium]|nr:MAG: SDR family oxidoreductase [Planctomycetota bacterium]